MFDRILIKSGFSTAEPYLSIVDLVDMMFYYGEVHITMSQFELKQLIDEFGEDGLFELITTKRLLVHPCDQHVGAVIHNDCYSAGMFQHNYNSIEQLLYGFHREFRKNSTENMKFARKYSKVLEEYRYPALVQDSIYQDIENSDLLSKVVRNYIKQYYPAYRDIDKIKISAYPTTSLLEGMYKLDSNLNMDELNTIHHQNGYAGDFSYSTIFLAIGETNQDCYLATELKAELLTNNRWAEIYKLRMNESVRKAEKSSEEINRFHSTVAFEFLSPGSAFEEKEISAHELINRLNSKDSIEFREWLKSIPNDTPISGAFYNEIANRNNSKPWVKALRVLSQIVFGLMHPIAGIAATTFDGFIYDKIFNRWYPKIFVDNTFRNIELKK